MSLNRRTLSLDTTTTGDHRTRHWNQIYVECFSPLKADSPLNYKCKFTSVHAMKSYKGTGDTAPLALNLSIILRWRSWLKSPAALPPAKKKKKGTHKYRSAWVPEPFWTVVRREKSPAHLWIWSLLPRKHSLFQLQRPINLRSLGT